jgi:replicative DNA helicase
MSENTENTLTAYLGPEFQQRLMWQLLVEPEFAEKIIPNLAVEYFDDPNLKRLFIIILEYFKEYEKVPNLQNQSIHQAINKYKIPNNKIEEESLFSVIKRVQLWNERVLNKEMLHDGDAVRKSTNDFIKQQEWRKFAEFIIEKTKSGEIKRKYTLGEIDEKLLKISHIGDEEDYGTEVTDNIDKALRKEFRQTIPTGVDVIDVLTGGGLGKGEIGVILTPSGVGKTTLLTKIGNNAYELGKNVLQIIFEDTTEQIQRKHYAIWSGVPLSKMDEEEENKKALKIVHEKAESLKGKGVLLIKRFSQENTTMMDIRNWMVRHQKKYGIKFDMIIIDYLDCLESHKKTPDRTEAELVIIKSFEQLSSDFDIPGWTAIQTNRSGFDSEFVEAYQTGGSIKRVQKAHFFMSVAKTKDQKEAQLANIRIIKARFAQDGQTFENCIFNNDTMQIRIEDDRYKLAKISKYTKHHDEKDVERIEDEANKVSTQQKIAEIITKKYDEILEKVNDDTVNDEKQLITPVDLGNGYFEAGYSGMTQSNHAPTIFEPYDTTVKKDDLIEIDTNTIIVNEGINEGVNEGASEGVKEPLLDWSGKTFTTDVQNEVPVVKIEDIKPIIDTNEQEDTHNSAYEYLMKARKKQGDITKK